MGAVQGEFDTGKLRARPIERGASGAHAVFRGRPPASPQSGDRGVGEKRKVADTTTDHFGPAPRASFGQERYIFWPSAIYSINCPCGRWGRAGGAGWGIILVIRERGGPDATKTMSSNETGGCHDFARPRMPIFYPNARNNAFPAPAAPAGSLANF